MRRVMSAQADTGETGDDLIERARGTDMEKRVGKDQGAMAATPWIIIGAAVTLLIVVVVLAFRNVDRQRHQMSMILGEKGAALIKAVEAGARTGMMGMFWGSSQVQTLLEETARQPDILYLTVTDGNGKILAASDRARVGETLPAEFLEIGGNLVRAARRRLTEDERGRPVFEVYRNFLPIESEHPLRKMVCRHGGVGKKEACCLVEGPNGVEDWCSPTNLLKADQFIFVGLEMAPFEKAHKADIRNTVIISSVLVLLGFGGFFSLFWAQSYRTARRLFRDSEAFAKEVVKRLPVGLIATDRRGRIAFFNDAAGKISGVTPADAQGRSPGSVFPHGGCPVQSLLEGSEEILEQDMSWTFPDRGEVPVSVSAARIVNKDGEGVGNALILRDLGEVRRLREEIRRKEKLAALGGLAAGVAHEIRNPLSSIKGLASYFGGRFEGRSEEREAADVMVREVDRLNRVITELLEFARPSDLRCGPVRLDELLNHSVRLIGRDAAAGKVKIELTTDGDQGAFLDPDRFSQCLLNLFLNAVQSMDNGGILSVESKPAGEAFMAVEVSDTGSGISREDLPKIFDPYFTNKPKGTGLGLAVVHKIIEAHKGRIEVKSTPGKGTVFTILVPRATH